VSEEQNTAALVRPQSNGGTDPVKQLSKYLDARTKNLGKYAASRIKPDVLIRLAVFEFSQNEWLRRCQPETVYASLILAAQIGLEPSGIKGEAYLVPFKGKCTLIPGWRGLVKLALRSKAVKSLYSHVVYEADEFQVWLGSDQKVVHRPMVTGQRGEIVCAYAVAHMENGSIDIEVMPLEDLRKIRDNASKSRGGKDGPAYTDWEDQMYRKAPIRRLCKRLPLGDDFFLAMKADELAESGEPEKINSFIDADFSEANATPSEKSQAVTDSIADRLAAKAAQTRAEQE
jgi:recombination protein RecT